MDQRDPLEFGKGGLLLLRKDLYISYVSDLLSKSKGEKENV
jgi:hypothetical protein